MGMLLYKLTLAIISSLLKEVECGFLFNPLTVMKNRTRKDVGHSPLMNSHFMSPLKDMFVSDMSMNSSFSDRNSQKRREPTESVNDFRTAASTRYGTHEEGHGKFVPHNDERRFARPFSNPNLFGPNAYKGYLK